MRCGRGWRFPAGNGRWMGGRARPRTGGVRHYVGLGDVGGSVDAVAFKGLEPEGTTLEFMPRGAGELYGIPASGANAGERDDTRLPAARDLSRGPVEIAIWAVTVSVCCAGHGLSHFRSFRPLMKPASRNLEVLNTGVRR